MLVGLIGLVVPIFPGADHVAGGAGLRHRSGFGTLGIVIFVLISLLALIGSLADNLFMGPGRARGRLLAFDLRGAGGWHLGTIIFPPSAG